jgi:phosphotransferase system enzyme I (PtsI)
LRRLLRGAPAAPGLASGPVVVFDRRSVSLPSRRERDHDAARERARLAQALDRMRRTLEEARRELAGDPELSTLLDAQLLLHRDELLVGQAEAQIGRGAAAEHAVRAASTAIAERLRGATMPYLAERARDVEQVGEAIVRELVGTRSALPDLHGPSLLVAWDLSPAEAIQLPRDRILGLATELGSVRGHTALLARALHVPSVVGLAGVTRAVEPGSSAVLDGHAGTLLVDPDDDERAAAETRADRHRAFHARLRIAPRPHALHRTACGAHVALCANVELEDEIDRVLEEGAEGIGLYRTEFLYLAQRGGLPDEAAQAAHFGAVVARLAPRPTTLRIFDLGAEKLHARLPSRAAPGGLGLRGVRLALSRPELLDAQLRAFLRAAAHGPVRVLVPMVATLDELRSVRARLDAARADLAARAVPFGEVELGAMIELPSAVFLIDAIARECAFVSAGTNDLAQYSLALDRTDPESERWATALEPAVLRALARIAEGAASAGCGLSVCGDLAADPLGLPLLVGLGYRSLSMAPAELPLAREALCRIDLELAARAATEALAARTASELAERARAILAPRLGGLWDEAELPPPPRGA